MRRANWLNPRLGPVSFCVVLFVFHALLREVLSRCDVVPAILAAGAHVPRWMISCAAVFVVLRLSVFLLVPGILVWRGATWALARLAALPWHTNGEGLGPKT